MKLFLVSIFILFSMSSTLLARGVKDECDLRRRLPTEWRIDPLRPATPGKPTMEEAYKHFSIWLRQVGGTRSGEPTQFGYLAANVDFSRDYSEVVFSADIPEHKNGLKGNRQPYHLKLLTGELKMLFLDVDGKRRCFHTEGITISPDKQWVAFYVETFIEIPRLPPGEVTIVEIEKTWVGNLKTGSTQELDFANAFRKFQFSQDSKIMFAQNWTDFHPINVVTLPQVTRYDIDASGTWSLTKSSDLSKHACGFGLNPESDEVIVAFDLGNWTCGAPEIGSLPATDESIPVPLATFSIPEFRGIPGQALAGGPAFDASMEDGRKYLGFYLFDLNTKSWSLLPIDLPNRIASSWKATNDGRYILYGAMWDYYAYDLTTGLSKKISFDQ